MNSDEDIVDSCFMILALLVEYAMRLDNSIKEYQQLMHENVGDTQPHVFRVFRNNLSPGGKAILVHRSMPA